MGKGVRGGGGEEWGSWEGVGVTQAPPDLK